jgi:hypothetical protein
MAKKSGPTLQKEAKERRTKKSLRTSDEDPDIAGIRPGPQPLPEQWDDFGDEE